MSMFYGVSVFVRLFVFLFVFLVVGLIVFTNCLLKAFAFCCGVMAGLLLKFMMEFGGDGDFFPPRYPIVFHNVCVLFL